MPLVLPEEIVDEFSSSKIEESSELLVLPPEIIEIILCKIPFPSILRNNDLNRKWARQLSGLCTPGSIREKIIVNSSGWPSYCPAYFNTDGSLTGFDRKAGIWKYIVNVSDYLDESWSTVGSKSSRTLQTGQNTVAQGQEHRKPWSVTCLGSLLCIWPSSDYKCRGSSRTRPWNLVLTNIITRACRYLNIPQRTSTSRSRSPAIHIKLLPGDMAPYRIMIVSTTDISDRRFQYLETQVYTRITGWKTFLTRLKRIQVVNFGDHEFYLREMGNHSVFLKNKLYCTCMLELSCGSDSEKVWIYQVWIHDYLAQDNNAWTPVDEQLPFGLPFLLQNDENSGGFRAPQCGPGVFCCGQDNSLFVIGVDEARIIGIRLTIYTLNLDRGDLSLLCCLNPDTFKGVNSDIIKLWLVQFSATGQSKLQCCSDFEFLYFNQESTALSPGEQSLLRFNTGTQEWDVIPAQAQFGTSGGMITMVGSEFNPGLNSFALV